MAQLTGGIQLWDRMREWIILKVSSGKYLGNGREFIIYDFIGSWFVPYLKLSIFVTSTVFRKNSNFSTKIYYNSWHLALKKKSFLRCQQKKDEYRQTDNMKLESFLKHE